MLLGRATELLELDDLTRHGQVIYDTPVNVADVHLIRTEDGPQEGADSIDPDIFRNLDSPASVGGESFSIGLVETSC